MPVNDAMKGKTVLVTGSTDGIGKATALGLAQMGAKVLMHGRTLKKAAGCMMRSPGRLAMTSSIFSSRTLPPKGRFAG